MDRSQQSEGKVTHTVALLSRYELHRSPHEGMGSSNKRIIWRVCNEDFV